MNRPNSSPQPRQITVAPVRKSVRVDAGAARAFDVFTAGLTRWWPRTHHIGAAAMKDAVIEPRVGGRWYERGDDGSTCDWGHVLVWEPNSRLVLTWDINADFQYDPELRTEIEVRFIADADGSTRVELEHRRLDRFGARREEMRTIFDKTGDWGQLLASFAQRAETSAKG